MNLHEIRVSKAVRRHFWSAYFGMHEENDLPE